MGTKNYEIRDRRYRNKLACTYDPEIGVIEVKLFGCRLLHIHFPPGTQIDFTFTDSEPIA